MAESGKITHFFLCLDQSIQYYKSFQFNREIFVWCYLPTIRCTNDSRIRFSRHVLAGMDQWSHWEYFCKHLTSVTSLLWHPGPRSSLPSLVHSHFRYLMTGLHRSISDSRPTHDWTPQEDVFSAFFTHGRSARCTLVSQYGSGISGHFRYPGLRKFPHQRMLSVFQFDKGGIHVLSIVYCRHSRQQRVSSNWITQFDTQLFDRG